MYNNLKGENLIFIISQPQAGSTLLQLMLSGSSEIATTSEHWISYFTDDTLVPETQFMIEPPFSKG